MVNHPSPIDTMMQSETTSIRQQRHLTRAKAFKEYTICDRECQDALAMSSRTIMSNLTQSTGVTSSFTTSAPYDSKTRKEVEYYNINTLGKKNNVKKTLDLIISVKGSQESTATKKSGPSEPQEMAVSFANWNDVKAHPLKVSG